MRFRSFQLARIAGIPVMIDYSWLPVVVLHLWLVSAIFLPHQLGRRVWSPTWGEVLFGTIITVLVFASVLAHELSHALVARVEGIQIHDIRLHIFGGWTRLASEPRTPLAELRVAIAGPACSFLLGMLFLAGLLVFQSFFPETPGAAPVRNLGREMFRYPMYANVILAMFNLMPGLPLDGGRALRAYLWHRRKDILTATQTAKRFGVAIAYMLISYGFFQLIYFHDLLSPIWFVLIGFFMKNAAESDYRHRERQRASEQAERGRSAQWDLAGTVGSVMSTPAISVPPEMRVSEFIDRILAAHRHTSFPVARDGRLHGILSLERLRAVPRPDWERLAVRDVMQPIDDSLFVPVRASIEFAARKLGANPLKRLAVVDGDGFLVGYLSARDLERAA